MTQESDLSRLTERYRALVDTAKTLTATLSADELYRAVYREASRVLEATGFYISLYDSSRDLATVVFYADQGDEERVQVSYRGSVSEVLRSGQATMITERTAGQPIVVLGDDVVNVTRSAIAAPLRYKGGVIGAISVQSYRPDAYAAEDLELLQAIADLAAVALETARHVAELDQQRLEAERIEEIGRALASSLDSQVVLQRVIDAAVELLSAEAGAVWLLEGATATVRASAGALAEASQRTFELSEPALDHLVQQRKPVVIEDPSDRPLLAADLQAALRTQSGLIVPLAINGGVVGMFSVGSKEPRRFQEDEVRLLERLASQASVALANAHLHEQLHALSLTDPLTELANRRHLELQLSQEIAAAKRGRRLSIVLFDLDNFKQYNDQYGHVAGDEVLRAFARILSAETRKMNLVARYGGDEFISVLAASGAEGAALHARRVLARVDDHPFLGPAGIRVSWGVAEFAREMTDGAELIQAADQALYDSKGGRPLGPDGHR